MDHRMRISRPKDHSFFQSEDCNKNPVFFKQQIKELQKRKQDAQSHTQPKQNCISNPEKRIGSIRLKCIGKKDSIYKKMLSIQTMR